MSNTMYFHLSLLSDNDLSEEMLKNIENINPTEFFNEEKVDELIDGNFESSWDSYDDDIIELSKRFPDEVFVLDYSGEGYYKGYYKNGTFDSTVGLLTYPDFDETRLVEKTPDYFEIVYINEDGEFHGKKYIVREDRNYPHHYLISDGKSHIGGGKLSRKKCVRTK